MRLMYNRGLLVCRLLLAGVDQSIHYLPPLLSEGSRALLGCRAERGVGGGIQGGIALEAR